MLTIKISQHGKNAQRVEIETIDTNGRVEVMVPPGFQLHDRAGFVGPWTLVRVLVNGTMLYQHPGPDR